MAKRQKLAVTAEKSKTKKRIKLKTKQERLKTYEFFIDNTLYYSNFALTDNKSLVLFFIDDNLITDFQMRDDKLVEFDLTENDLDISFDKNTLLKPNDNFHFEDFGYIRPEVFNWFKKTYVNCVFHPITRWFGKQVNTLLIVLEQRHGRPVGVVKTFT
jgi:hypothetical protein